MQAFPLLPQQGMQGRGWCFPRQRVLRLSKPLFYGYKLHAVCSIGGGFQSFDLSPASVHNINYLDDIKMQLSDCVLLGEKGDLSAEVQLSIFDNQQIELSTPMCKNQRDYREQPFVFKKSRKRIEILFSQLCDQFMIRRNYAKSFKGFKKRGCQK